MAERAEILTLLFADISHSTRIIQDFGDRVARDLIQRCLARVAQSVRQHGGQVRGRIGDELMCTFPDAREAIRAALAIQASVRAGGRAGEFPANIRMHLGLHHGPILIEQDQLFGDTIHIAKRMVDLAKTDQILTTQTTLSAAGAMPEIRRRLADEMRIKGYDDPVEIYEILRQDPGVTQVAQRVTRSPAGEHYVRCALTHDTQTFTLDAAHPVFSIGRDTGNDLIIPEDCVSRNHGRLEYQKGRIIFIDQSTNGTSILENDAPEPVLVHREQRWLRGSGLLCFGRRAEAEGPLSLRYRCERAADPASAR
ncbi:adenylate/guanylate cyclase domain-containing protein [Thiocystis violacea]|uniref:adenylate/guanylate cyclase domain-containing protein n=1 Tax=Thiocystis violacea TaxID=13725 RepID=UPI0019043EC3|nr:adenylate/guanylate cyclase domain-containing protein [Thiocystis violacea]MBK1721384.1 hypothetical protein [Thiocystis violacea]